jgi:hypothetical protein
MSDFLLRSTFPIRQVDGFLSVHESRGFTQRTLSLTLESKKSCTYTCTPYPKSPEIIGQMLHVHVRLASEIHAKKNTHLNWFLSVEMQFDCNTVKQPYKELHSVISERVLKGTLDGRFKIFRPSAFGFFRRPCCPNHTQSYSLKVVKQQLRILPLKRDFHAAKTGCRLQNTIYTVLSLNYQTIELQ